MKGKVNISLLGIRKTKDRTKNDKKTRKNWTGDKALIIFECQGNA